MPLGEDPRITRDLESMVTVGIRVDHVDLVAAMLNPEVAAASAAANAERALTMASFEPDPVAALAPLCVEAVNHHVGQIIAFSGRDDPAFREHWRALIATAFANRLADMLTLPASTARVSQ